MIAVRDAAGGGSPELRRPVVDDPEVLVLLARGDGDDDLVALATLRDDVDDLDAAARQAALQRSRGAGHPSDVLAIAAACGAAVTGGIQGPYDRRVDIRLSQALLVGLG